MEGKDYVSGLKEENKKLRNIMSELDKWLKSIGIDLSGYDQDTTPYRFYSIINEGINERIGCGRYKAERCDTDADGFCRKGCYWIGNGLQNNNR